MWSFHLWSSLFQFRVFIRSVIWVLMSALTKTLANLFWKLCRLMEYWALQWDHTELQSSKWGITSALASLFRVEIGRKNWILQIKAIYSEIREDILLTWLHHVRHGWNRTPKYLKNLPCQLNLWWEMSSKFLRILCVPKIISFVFLTLRVSLLTSNLFAMLVKLEIRSDWRLIDSDEEQIR